MTNTHFFFSAIEDNDINKVAEILAAQPQLVQERNGQGWTPLMKASWRGHDEMVTLLLKCGARLEDVCFGGTALMFAVDQKRVSTSCTGEKPSPGISAAGAWSKRHPG